MKFTLEIWMQSPTTRWPGVWKGFSIKTNKALTLIHHAIESKHDGIHAQNKSTAGEQYWKAKIFKFLKIKPKIFKF